MTPRRVFFMVMRAVILLFGVWMSVEGIIHMTTPGYAPTYFFRGAVVTPTFELVWGLCFVLAGLFVIHPPRD